MSYEQAEGELFVFQASFEDIARVDVLDEGGILDHAVVEVSRRDGEVFLLYLSGNRDEDALFVDALSSRVGTPATPPAGSPQLSQEPPQRSSKRRTSDPLGPLGEPELNAAPGGLEKIL